MEAQTTSIKAKRKSEERFSGAPWYPFYQQVIVGGAGGIGSWLTVFLAKQSHNVYLFDNDTVDISNLGGQLFLHDQIGQYKVSAVAKMCEMMNTEPINVYGELYTSTSYTAKYMFSCFDNMEARMAMFNNWYSKSSRILFVDGRMNAESAEMFCVYDERTANLWKESWFPDEKLPEAVCTFKSTGHCAALLASLMVAAFNNMVANVHAGDQRSVPFMTSIWLPTMTITTTE